jgi:hypothetical protein
MTMAKGDIEAEYESLLARLDVLSVMRGEFIPLNQLSTVC